MNWMKLILALSGGKKPSKPTSSALASTTKPPMRAPGPTPRGSGLAVIAGSSYPRSAVGESQYQDALSKICGGHSRDGHDHRCAASLVPDPTNDHDPNAVRVMIERQQVGWLSREDASMYTAALAKLGHAGKPVAVGAKIAGGWRTNQHDTGHFGVYLAMPWPLKLSQ